MCKIKITLFLLFVFVLGGCGSINPPDYEKITSAEQAGPHYVARNIKVSYDDDKPPYTIELLKTVEVVGDERYYITYDTYSAASGYTNFLVDSMIFSVDGNLISLKPSDFSEKKVYSVGNQYIAKVNKYFYELTEEQVREIASGIDVLVVAKSGTKVDQGKLLSEDIQRFKIFLKKFGDK